MKMQEIMQKKMPDPDIVPGMYCATGKAMCTDLDFEKMCQCNFCAIWKEKKLDEGEPMGYFCRDGEAR